MEEKEQGSVHIFAHIPADTKPANMVDWMNCVDFYQPKWIVK